MPATILTINNQPFTVYSTETRTPDGTSYHYFRTSVPVSMDQEGHVLRTKSYSAGSLEDLEARIRADQYTNAFQEIALTLPIDITIGELTDRYCDAVRPRIMSNTMQVVEKHAARIRHYLQDTKAIALNVPEALVFQGQLEFDERLSCKEVNATMSVLRKVLQFGKGEKLPIHNPLSYIDPLPETDRIFTLPPKEQLQQLLLALERRGSTGDLLVTLMHTGLRLGEGLALTRSNILADRHLLAINKHIVRIRVPGGQGYDQLLPFRKMHDSYYAAYSDAVGRYLARALHRQEDYQALNGSDFRNPHQYVFTDELGNAIAYNHPLRILKKTCKAVGMPPICIHDFRRMTAYYLHKDTGTVRLVQYQLGHRIPYSSAMYILSSTGVTPIPCSIADDLIQHQEVTPPYAWLSEKPAESPKPAS